MSYTINLILASCCALTLSACNFMSSRANEFSGIISILPASVLTGGGSAPSVPVPVPVQATGGTGNSLGPVTSFIAPVPSTTTTRTSDSLSFTVTDMSGLGLNPQLQCSLDGSDFSNCSSPVGVVVAVGAHSFKVKASDLAGNTSVSTPYAWTVTAPNTSGPTITGWIPCAMDGDTCKFSGTRRVVYGVSPTYLNGINSYTAGVQCLAANFGNPVADNYDTHRCWYEGTVVQPAPAFATSGPTIDLTKIAAPGSGYSTDRVQTSPATDAYKLTPSDIGAFRELCDFSHMAFDDPIVFPGQTGRSHLHVFFGNTGSDSASTVTSMANSGNSTCSGGTLNRTSYWAPALIDTKDGSPVRPISVLTYYKTGYNGIAPQSIQSVPAGLRMISGDAMAKSVQNPDFGRRPAYACVGGGPDSDWHNTIPNCAVGSQMWMSITFPQCWNGKDLDSPDHKSHMADTVNGACPADHPVAIPVISYNIHYPVFETNAPTRWRLSSDNYDPTLPAGYSGHADYFFGWKPAIMASFILNCMNNMQDCKANLLGDGTNLY